MLLCRWTPIVVLLLSTPAHGAPFDAVVVQRWREQLRTGDTLARQDAADELARLGPRAKAAIPELIQLLREPQVRRPCMHALVRIGTPAVPALLQALETQETHEAAEQTLGRIGPHPLPFLLRVLHSGGPQARLWSIQALGELGPKAEPAIPALVAVLKERRLRLEVEFKEVIQNVTCVPSLKAPLLTVHDDKAEERDVAARALTAIGPPAIPALLAVLEARKNRLRPSALLDLAVSTGTEVWPALGKEAEEGEALLPASLVVLAQMSVLGDALVDQDTTARCLALDALMQMNPPVKAAVPALLRNLRSCREPGKNNGPRIAALDVWDDRSSPVVRVALRALNRMGLEDRAAIPTLLRILRNPRFARSTDDVVSLLLKLGEEGKERLRREGLPILLARMKEEDPVAIQAAFAALNDLDSRRAAAVLTAAEELLKRQNEETPVATAVFQCLTQAQTKAAPILIHMLDHRSADIRARAALLLGRIEPAPRTAIPALKGLLRDPENEVPVAAMQALDQIDPEPKAQLSRLIAALKGTDVDVQRWALSKLGQLGPAAEPALPQVRRLLAGDDSKLALAAAEVLLTLGEASPALLTQLLGSEDEEARKLVLEHLATERCPRSPKIVASVRRLLHERKPEEALLAARALLHICPEQGRLTLPRIAITLKDSKKEEEGLALLKELLAVLPVAFPHSPPSEGGLLYDGTAEKKRALAPVVRALLRLLDDERRWPLAAACLAHLEPRPRAVPGLLIRLQAEAADERATAAACLGCLADPSPDTVQRLRRLLEDEEPTVRVAAATALLQLTGKRKTYAPVLERELPKGLDAVACLCELPATTRRLLVPALLATLRKAEPGERAPVITALGQLGAEAGPAVPALMAFLADPSSAECSAAVETLGKIGPAARAALPRLRQLARNEQVATEAKAATRAIARKDG